MTIERNDGVVRLSGHCQAEDAEPLLKLLSAGVVQVDLSGCEYLHGAVLQLLMAARPTISGEPAPFLRDWIIPLISRQSSACQKPES